MKAKLIIILLTALCWVSCKINNDEKYKKAICGEWTFAETQVTAKTTHSPVPAKYMKPYAKEGYVFYPNNVCENKLGYYEFRRGKTRIDSKVFFLGNDTKYKIEDDSLKIFDLIDKVWKSKKIHSISQDTMKLSVRDSTYEIYTRTRYQVHNFMHFDKIIISSSAFKKLSIDKNGNVIFVGGYFSSKKGQYVAKVNVQDYLKIERNFNKSDINRLLENYSADCTDQSTVSVTFIVNDKIYKTISDYGRESPTEFKWAYFPTLYLYQRLDLKPISETNIIGHSTILLNFETPTKFLNLSQSEEFYLLTELCKSKETKHKFKKKYTIEYWEDYNDSNTKTMVTDGRYYELEKDNSRITLDLGYDFILRNNLMRKFEKKEQTE